jgi:hypothetical protein
MIWVLIWVMIVLGAIPPLAIIAWMLYRIIKGVSEDGQSRLDFVVLLSLLVVVTAFVAFEMAGLLLPGWHTISYYAHANRWLDYLISALFLAGGAGGFIWWRHHVSQNIPR